MSAKPPPLRVPRGSAFHSLPWGLGLLVMGVGLASLPRESRSQAAPPRPAEAAAPAPALCEAGHAGGDSRGASGSLDLPAIRRAYTALAAGLARKLGAVRREPAGSFAIPDRPHDAGLPACRETAQRRERLPLDLGRRLRGRTLYFASLERLGDFELPPELGRDPGAMVFLTKARGLKDLRSLEGRLGRPVGLATGDFARALGVRCANTFLTVSENGDAGTFHESP